MYYDIDSPLDPERVNKGHWRFLIAIIYKVVFAAVLAVAKNILN